MALYKDMLEKKMRRFNELKGQEESVLNSLESLPVSWKTLDKVEKTRADLQEIFETCYEDLYHSYEDYRLRETPKPEQLMEEPKPEQLMEEPMRVWSGEISIVDPHIWSGEIKADDNPDVEVQPNSNTESDEDKEKKNVLKCPKCWAEDHEPGAKFCNVCGALISGEIEKEKDMEENGQLRINFETEEEAEQDDNAEVEENGQLRIPFENEEETEDDEK